MKCSRDYCGKCDKTVEVREVPKHWGATYEWRCLVCGGVTNQDIDHDFDDDPEEE